MNAIKRIEKTLDFLEESFRKKALSLFGQLLKSELPVQVMRCMRQAKEEPGKTEEVLSGFEMPGRKRYIALFERYIQELFIQGMNLGIKEIEERKAAISSKRVGFTIEVTGDPVLPANAIRWMDSWTETFGNDYYDDVTKDVVRVMKNALEAGYSVPDVMDRLKTYLTGDQYTKARLEVIARTNATTAFNQGRLESFRQDDDFVRAVRYSSILDTRTTDICKSRHGKIMLLDSKELAANTPPLHYQCRSILLPVDKFSWEDMQDSPRLKEKMDWTKWKDENGQVQDVPPPGKGFGNVGNALKNKAESDIITGVKADTGAYGVGKRTDKRDVAGNQVEKSVALKNGGKITLRQSLETPGVNDWSDFNQIIAEINEPPSGKFFNTKILDGITDEIINGGLYDVETGQAVKGYYDRNNKLIVSTRSEVKVVNGIETNTRLSAQKIASNKWHEIAHLVWEKEIRNNDELKYQFYDLMRDALETDVFADMRTEMLKSGKMRDLEEFFCDRFREYYQNIDKLKYIEERMAKLSNRRIHTGMIEFFDDVVRSENE